MSIEEFQDEPSFSKVDEIYLAIDPKLLIIEPQSTTIKNIIDKHLKNLRVKVDYPVQTKEELENLDYLGKKISISFPSSAKNNKEFAGELKKSLLNIWSDLQTASIPLLHNPIPDCIQIKAEGVEKSPFNYKSNSNSPPLIAQFTNEDLRFLHSKFKQYNLDEKGATSSLGVSELKKNNNPINKLGYIEYETQSRAYINDAIRGITNYMRLPRDHLGFFARTFDAKRGYYRANAYKEALKNPDLPTAYKMQILFALFDSKDGLTLQREVRNAIFGNENAFRARGIIRTHAAVLNHEKNYSRGLSKDFNSVIDQIIATANDANEQTVIPQFSPQKSLFERLKTPSPGKK